MKALRTRKNQIRLIVITCVLIAASCMLFAVFNMLGGMLTSQRAAESFRGESEQLFAQVSAYFPVGSEISESDIYSFDMTLEADFVTASLEAPEGGSLYKQAYTGTGTVTVKSDKTSVTAAATGVGGDFFFFHPLYLRSGNYFSGDDLMHDYVILDEELAWRLFGGVDLAGMTVTINDEPYVIAGVIAREDDFASKKAYTQGVGLYMSYDKLNAINETKINTFELVAADPIDGFAKSEVEKKFTNAEVIENSARFSLLGIFKVIGSFAERSMNTTGVILPYWENAARYVENVMAIVLIFAILLGIFPVIVIISGLVALIKYLFRTAKTKVPELIEGYQEKRYRKKMEKRGER